MEAMNGMLDILIGAVAYVINITVAFMSDGMWKTAGNSITHFYWQVADPRRSG
jgi:hypothetical protein